MFQSPGGDSDFQSSRSSRDSGSCRLRVCRRRSRVVKCSVRARLVLRATHPRDDWLLTAVPKGGAVATSSTSHHQPENPVLQMNQAGPYPVLDHGLRRHAEMGGFIRGFNVRSTVDTKPPVPACCVDKLLKGGVARTTSDAMPRLDGMGWKTSRAAVPSRCNDWPGEPSALQLHKTSPMLGESANESGRRSRIACKSGILKP